MFTARELRKEPDPSNAGGNGAQPFRDRRRSGRWRISSGGGQNFSPRSHMAYFQCLDHIIVLGEEHLRRILKNYADYYNGVGTHRSLNKDAPASLQVQRFGGIKVP